jgi:photosystem II stability/assembly factor-like uncharacterized protein/predicted esterase
MDAGDANDDGDAGDASDIPCTGKPGTFHDQPFTSGGETRHYYLHVPSDYRCQDAWPMLVDFHGTGFSMNTTDTVEESWATDEMVAVADAEHFIVVRPRSRYKAETGGYVYQWDINPGDLGKNRAFAVALVQDIEQRYHVDPRRLYASGFSNGPAMATQFLADDPLFFHGFGLVAGGLNDPVTRAHPFDAATAPRVYDSTGYRDYMRPTLRSLVTFAGAQQLPADHLWIRESDTGHELYGWHFREMFGWMDRGERPPPGTLAKGWSRETFAGAQSLIQLGRSPSGKWYATASDGAIWRRDAAGIWTQTATLESTDWTGQPFAPSLSDICFDAQGRGYAVGDGVFVTSADGSSWTVAPKMPEFGAMQFGFTYATSIACGASRVTAGGVWSSATSSDAGHSWSAASMQAQGAAAFVSAVRAAPSGTWLALGYWDYMGQSSDGVTYGAPNPPQQIQWYNDGASAPGGKWWVVGEKGTIDSSSDDAASFTAQTAPLSLEDLYAVAFGDDGLRGMAVGAHGAAYVTTDGGATWTDASTGLDGFLGDVKWIDAHTLLVVGEHGTVLTFTM